MKTGLIIGALVLIGGALLLGLLWRRRQAQLAGKAKQQQQAAEYHPSQVPQIAHEDVTSVFSRKPEPPPGEPLTPLPYLTPPAMIPAQREPAIVNQASDASLMPYAQVPQAVSHAGMVRETKPHYQEVKIKQEMARMRETPIPPQETMNSMDPLLENAMRQAQVGLFAIPGKEEHS
ncbi:MAG: hypothetical protein NVSMB38_17250 [Ktedonobacteraceae bacterium]